MFCKNCGTKNDEGSHFCMECGMPMDPAIVAQRVERTNIQINDEVQQPVQQPVYEAVEAENAEAPRRSYKDKLMTCVLPDNTMKKLPFPSYILKFIRIGIWTLMVLAIFFSWFFIRVSFFEEKTKESMNLIKVALGGCDSAIMSIIGFITLLTVLAAAGIHIFNTFGNKEIKIPEFLLCAAPAAITLLYMICAWIASASVFGDYSGYDAVTGMGLHAGPGFGAWLVFILSSIETAAWFLFVKDKNEPLVKF